MAIMSSSFLLALVVVSSWALVLKKPMVPAPVPQPIVPYPQPLPPMADQKTEEILATGTKVAKVMTAKLVAPFVFGASKVAGMAGALPPLLAAQGAFLGKLIAVPIQVTAAATSGLVSGITGVLVGIPVGLGTGAVVAAHQLKPLVGQVNGESLHFLKKKLYHLKSGHHQLMQPVAVIDGGKYFLLGSAVDLMGAKMQALGSLLTKAGYKASAAGQAMSAKYQTPILLQPMVGSNAVVAPPVYAGLPDIVGQVNARNHGAVAAIVPVPGQAFASSGAVSSSYGTISLPSAIPQTIEAPKVPAPSPPLVEK